MCVRGHLSNDTYLASQLSVSFHVTLAPIYASNLSPTTTQKCLVTEEHICSILHQAQPGAPVSQASSKVFIAAVTVHLLNPVPEHGHRQEQKPTLTPIQE